MNTPQTKSCIKVLVVLSLFVFLSLSNCFAENFVWVKYRSTPVDLDQSLFAFQDTSESSWIRGAWYDSDNKYLIIKLEGTYYHYCGVPNDIWRSFTNFSSHGSYGKAYNRFLKSKFDCRINYVPSYKQRKD